MGLVLSLADIIVKDRRVGIGTDEYERRVRSAWRRFIATLEAGISTGETLLEDAAFYRAAEAQFRAEWEEASSLLVERVGIAEWKEHKLGDAFTVDNPHTIEWLKTHGSELVTSVSAETRMGIRATMQRGFAQHKTVDEIARSVRPLIGIRPDQHRAVVAYQNRLGQTGYTAAQVEEKAEAYSRKLLAQRAKLIARTEVQDAQNAGNMQSWLVARDEGLILPETVRVWIAGKTDRTCPLCMALQGATATLEGSFSAGGDVWPRPPRHPGCRCTHSLKTVLRKIWALGRPWR